MRVEMLFRTVFLKYLLWRLFGLNQNPCNPYIGCYYSVTAEGKIFTGNNIPEGSHRKLKIPDYPDDFNVNIKGVQHFVSYKSGVITLFVGGEYYKRVSTKLHYNKMVFIMSKTNSSYEEGLFEYIGVHKGLLFMHFMDCREMLKSSNRINFDFFEMISTPYDCGFVCGKDNSAVSIILILIASISSLINIINIKEPKSEKLRESMVILFSIIVGITSLQTLLNLFNGNNVKIFCYWFFPIWIVKFIEYRKSILNHKKFCVETAGNPVKCRDGDFYFILKRNNSEGDNNLCSYAINQRNYINKSIYLLAKELHKYATNDSHKDEVYSTPDLIGSEDGDEEKFFSKFKINNCYVEVSRDNTIVSLKLIADSVFNNKTVEYTKTMCSESFNTLLTILQCSSIKGNQKDILFDKLKNSICRNQILGGGYTKELKRIGKGMGKGCYFKPFSAGDSGYYRHCMSFKNLMETLSSGSFGFILKVNRHDSWVLGGADFGTVNGISSDHLEILVEHNKRFFGEKRLEAIWEMNSVFSAKTLKGMLCSQWKKYQVEYMYLIKKLGYMVKRPVDHKRYKCSPWVEGFINEEIEKLKNKVKVVENETVVTDSLNNSIKIEEIKNDVENIKEMEKLEEVCQGIPENEFLEFEEVSEVHSFYFKDLRKEFRQIVLDEFARLGSKFESTIKTSSTEVDELKSSINKIEGVISKIDSKKSKTNTKDIEKKAGSFNYLKNDLDIKKANLSESSKVLDEARSEMKKLTENKSEALKNEPIWPLVWSREEDNSFENSKKRSKIRRNVYKLLKDLGIYLKKRDIKKVIEMIKSNHLGREESIKIMIKKSTERNLRNIEGIKNNPIVKASEPLKEFIKKAKEKNELILKEKEEEIKNKEKNFKGVNELELIDDLSGRMYFKKSSIVLFHRKVYGEYFNNYYRKKKRSGKSKVKKKTKEGLKLRLVLDNPKDNKKITLVRKRQKCPVFMPQKMVGKIILSLLIKGELKQGNKKILENCKDYGLKKSFRKSIISCFI